MAKRLFCILFLFCLQIGLYSKVDGLRVLGVFQHTGKSQNRIIESLVMGLIDKGHKVTIVTHFPIDNPPDNLTQIDLSGSIPIWQHIFTFDQLVYRPFFGIEQILRAMSIGEKLWESGKTTCKVLLANREVIALKKGDFDIAVVHQFNSDCGLGLTHILGIPSIGISAHIMMPFVHSRLGFISNPSFVPSHFLGYGRRPTLYQSLQNLFISFYMNYKYAKAQESEHRIIEAQLGVQIPHLEDIAKNMSMLFVNTFYPLHGAYPSTPNILEISGLHLKPIKPLPEEIESYLAESENGVIVFNMGSMLKSVSWPEDKLKAFKEAFSSIPQRVLWKWENDSMPSLSSNIKTLKWLPQYDILNHEKVKLFITHGGMLGMSEAVHCGVPMIVIPIFGDQFADGAAAEDSGVGVVLNFHEINKQSILSAINSALQPEIQSNSKKLSGIWKDRPVPPLESAVYWIEHVAKHGSAHLKSPHTELPFYKFILLDLLLLILFIIIFSTFVVYKIMQLILYKIFAKRKNKID